MSECVDLLFEDVYRRLVGFELLVLEEYLPPQLEGGGQEGVITEVALKQETHHQTLTKHRLGEEDANGSGADAGQAFNIIIHYIR